MANHDPSDDFLLGRSIALLEIQLIILSELDISPGIDAKERINHALQTTKDRIRRGETDYPEFIEILGDPSSILKGFETVESVFRTRFFGEA